VRRETNTRWVYIYVQYVVYMNMERRFAIYIKEERRLDIYTHRVLDFEAKPHNDLLWGGVHALKGGGGGRERRRGV
jgi:hypothetical protein